MTGAQHAMHTLGLLVSSRSPSATNSSPCPTPGAAAASQVRIQKGGGPAPVNAVPLLAVPVHPQLYYKNQTPLAPDLASHASLGSSSWLTRASPAAPAVLFDLFTPCHARLDGARRPWSGRHGGRIPRGEGERSLLRALRWATGCWLIFRRAFISSLLISVWCASSSSSSSSLVAERHDRTAD